MGNIVKNRSSFSRNASRGSSLGTETPPDSWWSRSNSSRTLRKHFRCDQNFYAMLQTQISYEDVRNLQEIFVMLNRTTEQVSTYLHFWLMNIQFNKIYERELERYKSLHPEYEGSSSAEFVKNHCLGVLVVHTELVHHVDNLQKFDAILKQIAASHMFLGTKLKKLDEELFKFLRHEFRHYIHKETVKSLRKYMKITTSRIQYLINEKVKEHDLVQMKESMREMRGKVIRKMDAFNELRLLYVNKMPYLWSEHNMVIEPSMPTTSTSVDVQS